jgi:hypothetical protein
MEMSRRLYVPEVVLPFTNCIGAEWCQSRSGRFGGREISLFFDSSPNCIPCSHAASHYCCSVDFGRLDVSEEP